MRLLVEDVTLEHMVLRWEMFCKVIGSISFAWFPDQVELALRYLVFYLPVCMSKSLESFWRRLAVRTPFSVEFLVDMRFPFAGCGWLSLDSSVMMGTACWPSLNMPPVSALATEETTFCRVLQMTWMAPLSRGRPEVPLLR